MPLQPVPTPTPAPAPPAPAQAPGRATITFPGGALPLEGVPRSAAEVRGLRAVREELRSQLERATNRREEIVHQLAGDRGTTLPAEARAGVQRRLDLLDERIIQLERQQAGTEQLLASASPEVLSSSTRDQRDVPGMVDEDDAAGIAFGTFSAGVVLTLVLSRFWRRRRARRGGPRPAAASDASALADDPRFAQLTQAVDAIAEEVERIGEGQRFVTQLLSSRPEERVIEPRR